MDVGSKPEKSTGFTQPTGKESEGESAQLPFTENKGSSPASTTALTRDASKNTSETEKMQPLVLTAQILMAIAILLGDFKALKELSSTSKQVVSNGKIYWLVDLPGHNLTVEAGKLMVDGQPLDSLLEKLMAEKASEK